MIDRVKNTNVVEVQKLFENFTNVKKKSVRIEISQREEKNESIFFVLSAELDDDLGYATLPTDSNRFVVHDKTLRLELNEFSRRIKLIIDNRKELKHFQTSIQNELTRARTALSHPMRRAFCFEKGQNRFLRSSSEMKTAKTIHFELDLQNLIVQQLGDFLPINFEEFQKVKKTTKFDKKSVFCLFSEFNRKSDRIDGIR